MHRLEMTEEQQRDIERDAETVRGIARVNDALLRFFTRGDVRLALLTLAVGIAGTAPKRWKP